MDYLGTCDNRGPHARAGTSSGIISNTCFFSHNIFTTSRTNLSAKNAEVNDDAIKALIAWWQQIDFKADYINSWAKGEADIMEIKPFNIFKIP